MASGGSPERDIRPKRLGRCWVEKLLLPRLGSLMLFVASKARPRSFLRRIWRPQVR